ncbi:MULTISPECIES: hypothetical protein [Streptomyces]|uniref:XRE family transcriptional regulator n=1 Tax=Streptomyces stelliscabiei TaxID=146820 RepID=A0A8I0NYY7_9ACTN|nr:MULTISPECIES: hypothetical protein [Streptomyces]KND41455.1 hypothetical protein IQ64_29080 [Streptomyces stelliscabiei]MBE1596248.1 hypothetical protein [Streptomyces stelliscabiei]MDX2518063.1 hypothetical protein [Streptomyces stelliscabiei]MDX2555683.1 hypothetical protein [Streptomyces stelliscabiei]MDX2614330.1 hypothetical protein [Streptomyces stelliscabiei]
MRHATEHADVATMTDAATAELESVLRGGPFHVALRAAIAARGLPLQRVQHHLSRYGVKVGVTSLSYWQQGARRPQRPESLRAVRALEEILQLPDESLIRLLARADDHPGPERPAGRSYRSVVEASDVLERLLGELRVPLDGGVHTVGHHERVRVGAGRELLGRESQHIVRAHKDGVDRYVAVHHGDPGCAPERMAVRALENCRSGRVRWDRETGVLVAELLFDTRLRSGDTYLFRYGFDDGTAGVCTEYVRGFRSTGGQYALQVRFDERALPLRCHRFSQHSAAAPRSGRQILPLSGPHRSVHLVEPRVRTGVVGIGWDWE